MNELGLVAKVSAYVGVSSSSVRRIAASAAHRYKLFEIPKRKGGARVVAQPAREVKALQRALVAILFEHLPVHAAAMAYRSKVSIRDNAEMHVRANYLLKLDFKNFFLSIDRAAIRLHLISKCALRLSDVELDFITSLVLWRDPFLDIRGLCIGAPSSPLISNSVMYDFDEAISLLSSARGVRYSRYSDDLTFSATEPDVLQEVEALVRRVVEDLAYPKLKLNEEKRVNVSRKHALHVTGLTLTNDHNVSVGRARKRGVRAGVDRFVRIGGDEAEFLRIKGELGFVLGIEPSFRDVLLRKYGAKCLPLLPRLKH